MMIELGTLREPRFHAGPEATQADVRLHQRYFSFASPQGLVIGCDMNVVFALERTPAQVWPVFKDLNQWHQASHYYSGVFGDLYDRENLDLGTGTFRMSDAPGTPLYPSVYTVLKVIPERLVVAFQPIPEDGSSGGVSPGFHVCMLHPQEQGTLVTILMQHALRSTDFDLDARLESLRRETPEWIRKWRDDFIPTLKRRFDTSVGTPR
jgi:hypothetical protein